MMRPLLSALLGTVVVSALNAAESVMLAEPDVKLGLKIEATTSAKGGKAISSGAAGTTEQTVDVSRHRVIQRTMHPDAIGGEVTYRFLQDRIITVVDGKTESSSGALDGKVAKGLRNGAGNWTFTLADGTATGDEVGQLELAGGFENRHWLPGKKVEVGESWNFSPNFIRSSLKLDLPAPEVSGVMTLREIGKAPDGGRQAIIDLFIRGGGKEFLPDGGVKKADGGLTGNLTVNLDRPGQMRMHLTGKLATGSREGGESAGALLPLTMSVKIDPMGN
ncbi:hypothetical protein [Luteolibacter marinus]|uniref:hypothetical protein n=1 Tax=Luteolibacter marinus TaxID=2776705 RepID=UPI001D0104DC|nr:hypothetical protein [Luteolibacter marinus]